LRKTLTAAAVVRIKPPATGQVEHFDKGFPGLALRVSYGGGKSWVFFYRVGGRLKRLTLGTYPALDLAQAREAWREARQTVAMGRDPAEERKRQKPAVDFASVAEEWLKRDQEKNRTAAEARRIIHRYVLPHWAGLPITDIGRREILDLVDGIADRGAVIMARRVHSRLHRVFGWCVARGILAANPMTGLPKPGAETTRDRVLSDEEIAAAWIAAEGLGWPFGPLFQLLILTGARRDEIGGLRWAEVQDANLRLAGDRTKNATPHSIPLSVPARAIIEKLPRIAGTDFVFTTNGKTPVSGWSKAKLKLDAALLGLFDPTTLIGGAKVPSTAKGALLGKGTQKANGTNVPPPLSAPWRTHDIRRSVATGLQRLGVTLQAIEAVLGHVSGSRAGVVGIYQRHSFDAEKAAALEAWGAHVMSLIEGKQRAKVLPMRGRQ
jgi:integrase